MVKKYKNEAAREIAIKKYNLDKPVFEQYTLYMNDLIHGDLGESIVRPGRDVGTTISQSFPVTARLGAIAFCLSTSDWSCTRYCSCIIKT